jgi:hypothetical protein
MTEISELRQRLQNFDDKKIDVNELNAAVGVYSQTEKRLKIIMKAMDTAFKMGLQVDSSALVEILGKGKIKSVKKLQDRTANRGRS